MTGGLAENGKDYKWVSYRDFFYGHETCEPVKYDQTLPYIPCYLRQVRVEGCNNRWYTTNRLGFCNEDDGKSWVTTCNDAFMQTVTFTTKTADVLCMTTVARREMVLTHVDVLTARNVKTKPWMVLTGIHCLFLVIGLG